MRFETTMHVATVAGPASIPQIVAGYTCLEMTGPYRPFLNSVAQQQEQQQQQDE